MKPILISMMCVVVGSAACCVPSLAPYNYAADSLASTTTDGQAVRIPTWQTSSPFIGECVKVNFELEGSTCVVVTDPGPPALPDLPRGTFKYSSRIVSITGNVSASAGPVDAKGGFQVVTHQLVMEWSRSKVIAPKSVSVADATYVEAIEYGVAIRVILDVRLVNASASTNLAFGFGSLAAALANNQAQIDVHYDTSGVTKDILPTNAPTNVSSVNDLVAVDQAFYSAIADVSQRWNVLVGATTSADSNGLSNAKATFASAPAAIAYLVHRSEPQKAEDAAKAATLRATLSAESAQDAAAAIQASKGSRPMPATAPQVPARKN